ncbi:FUSC family protein [Microbacterium sp. G2-8]|uniref:FUSC family protein n=1 Tax=Microbacterium sp. G2-8 TaxID=2842454 RepID=UPI001C89CD4F|nr:FUSC family protein [Microbacterium sp. G2-8]
MPRRPLTEAIRIRPRFEILPTLRSQRLPHDVWFERSTSIVIAGALPILALALLGRIDLASYTLVGSMTALFTHGHPARQRARTLALFSLAVITGSAVSLAAAAALDSTYALIAVACTLAAVTKVAIEASRVGPPGAVIPIFLFSGLMFAPQSWADVPLHVALVAVGAATAWVVVMTPFLWRPCAPERRAVATALAAAADLHDDPDGPRAQGALAAAIHDAWSCLGGSGADLDTRRDLESHLVAAERVLAAPRVRGDAAEARAQARQLRRSSGPIPPSPLTDDERAQIDGVRIAEHAAAPFASRHPILAALRPGSAATPFFLRVLIGCALAASLSHLLGVGRPYWAIVTAASLIQPNLLLTWRRAPQRTLGTVVGVGVFALLAPVAHLHPLLLVALVLALNGIVEFVLPRNYFLGQALVTPMALFISEFAAVQPVAELTIDRLLDTVIGAACGLLAAFAIRNGHARRRTKDLTEDLARRANDARAIAAASPRAPERVEAARRGLVAGLARLRQAFHQADGEWWAHSVDEASVVAVESRAHRALAALEEAPR